MSNETPEQIAERIINQVCLTGKGISSHENLTSKCCCELQKDIAEAIRKERVVRVPKLRLGLPYIFINGYENAIFEIKKLNEGKTFVEGVHDEQ